MIVDKNKKSWDAYSDEYCKFNNDQRFLNRIRANPSGAFHPVVWEQIQKYIPDMKGKRVCVPSSGDNHAVFAFALMGAQVISCDISQNQLDNGKIAAEKLGVKEITFIQADTMTLEKIEDNAYDFVYTSNGVHVWINDLKAMYGSIHRIMKPGGVYIMYDIHPFQRPFDDSLKVIKPYDMTGPFEDENNVTFAWRVRDIVNAMLDSGINIKHVEEMFAEKDYEDPFFVSSEDLVHGLKVSREEVDRMHDWRQNPAAALPNWLCITGMK